MRRESSPEPPAPVLEAHWLGRVGYADALRLQDRLVRRRRRDEIPDTLVLVEHTPVITLGRSARVEHVLWDAAERASRGVEMFEAGRGGDVTWHGPGQLVGYPIVALEPERRDVHRYLRDLERALILTAADLGVDATRIPGRTGVWSGGRKLAAIGIRLSTGWITSHGFALNVSADLSGFASIVPCGIRDAGVTSLVESTGVPHRLEDVAGRAARRVAEVLGRPLRAASPSDAFLLAPSTRPAPAEVRP